MRECVQGKSSKQSARPFVRTRVGACEGACEGACAHEAQLTSLVFCTAFLKTSLTRAWKPMRRLAMPLGQKWQ